MPESLRKTFQALSGKEDRNISEVVTEVVEGYVQKHDPDYKVKSPIAI
ncbi:thioredoxin ['Nostoc azollae' 0708]|jgi:hypothetical protein|uniref:Thioredoxin n=2 Tax=Trichormus azollae TaxID=1164 RepID=D7E0X6_NOSA0|nr:thioredoxin ['Nostoc azollae' 0708]